jgi:hypothetical protein
LEDESALKCYFKSKNKSQRRLNELESVLYEQRFGLTDPPVLNPSQENFTPSEELCELLLKHRKSEQALNYAVQCHNMRMIGK